MLSAVPKQGLAITGEIPDYRAEIAAEVTAPVVVAHGEGQELARNIAVIIGRHFGASDEALEDALATVELPEGRLSRTEAGSMTVIDDSYNANPLSMKFGLKSFAEQAAPGRRRVAVLADMLELGSEARRYHEEIGAYAREMADVLVGVGELARHYQPQHWFANADECARGIDRIVAPGDIVFVKGSGGMEMAKVVKQLAEGLG